MPKTKQETDAPLDSPASVGIRDFGEWCKQAGLYESAALLQLTGGDHAAAFMLQSALLWGEGAAVKSAGGWFWRKAKEFAADLSLTRHTLERARKCLKARIGLQEDLRHPRLPGGGLLLECVTHYRIDPVAFRAAFDFYCLAAITDGQFQEILGRQMLTTGNPELPENDNAGMPEISNAGLPEGDNAGLLESDNAGMPESGNAGMPESGNAGMPQISSYKALNQSSFESSQSSSQSSLSTAGAPDGAERDDSEHHHPGKDDLPHYLHNLYDQLGTPNGKTTEVLALCAQLGLERASAVAERCENYAQRWAYVVSALKTELEKPAAGSRKNLQRLRVESESAVGQWADFFKR